MKMKLLPLAIAASLCACASPSQAGNEVSRIPSALASVTIVDRSTGQVLPTYRQGSDYWVAGEPGHRYAISVGNNIGSRLMAVMSVDGINVISGQTAWRSDLGAQTGYVFAPGERAEITGWRKSQADVAVFEFAAPSASYAAQTGRGNEIGAIGVALFRELIRPVPVPVAPPISYDAPPVPSPQRESARNSAGAAFDSAKTANESGASDQLARAERSLARPSAPAAAAAAPSLGTAHGERQSAWVDYTSFTRQSTTPDQIIVIRYDRRETLVARGIIPVDNPRLPDPFPVAGGFVPDPPRR